MLLARSSHSFSSGSVSKPTKPRRGRKTFDELFGVYQLYIVTAELIDRSGIKIVYYSRCLDKTLYYVVNRTHSDKCSECLRSGQPYNVVSLSLKGVRRLLSDKSSLKADLSSVLRLDSKLASKPFKMTRLK